MIFVLVFYILYLLAFIAFSAMGIYHLWRFGYIGDLTKPVIITYSTISIIIIIFSIVVIATRDWPTQINII